MNNIFKEDQEKKNILMKKRIRKKEECKFTFKKIKYYYLPTIIFNTFNNVSLLINFVFGFENLAKST